MTAQTIRRTVAAGLVVSVIGVTAALAWRTGAHGTPSTTLRVLSGLSAVIILAGLFGICRAVARWALSSGGGVCAAARAVLDEALRMKVAVVFMLLLLVILPMLPLVIAADQPLRYRIQTFLSYSLGLTGFLLSLMTIFLACGTLAWEIENKQIFTVATKPIGRTAFLAGKWLGIITLDAVLMLVACAAIYGFTEFYLARLKPMDATDARAMQAEVLTARVVSDPLPSEPLSKRVSDQLERMEKEEPKAIEDMGRAALASQGRSGSPKEAMDAGREAARVQITNRVYAEWMSVAPLGMEVYVFEGLGRAKRENEQVQMEYRIRAAVYDDQQELPMRVSINGQEADVRLVANMRQTIPIRSSIITDDGKLVVAFGNPDPRNTVSFLEEDGLRVLYRAGGFGANFVRAGLVMWVRLAFLAMLGLATATCLSFPVACVAALLVYFAALSASFLGQSLADTARVAEGALGWIDVAMRGIAAAFTTLFRAYSRLDTTDRVVGGRLIGWGEVLTAVAWIGVGWTAVVGAIGALIFRARELARVQV